MARHELDKEPLRYWIKNSQKILDKGKETQRKLTDSLYAKHDINEAYVRMVESDAYDALHQRCEALETTSTKQAAELERLHLTLRYLAELGGGNSEGNYYAKSTLKHEEFLKERQNSGALGRE